MFKKAHLASFVLLIGIFSCNSGKKQEENKSKEPEFTGAEAEVKIMTLAPGHFHASLVLKTMYELVDPTVYVYAPEGPELEAYLAAIEGYNERETDPTKWEMKVYTGTDFLEKMISEKPGNVMVIAGNNQRKTEYIKETVDAGINVLADKPMAIDIKGFELLKEAFASAEKNNVLLYDIMTERYSITTLLQKEFSMMPEVFGTLQKGSLENPAITKESVHHFFKEVSGKTLTRPAWFFDVEQEGNGIVDVTTHLVDLVQWECFPEQIIDYENDIEIINAQRSATELSPSQFEQATQLSNYPDYLEKDIIKDSILNVYANGAFNYRIKDVHARVSVRWNFEAPEGTGDTHFSIMRGGKANLVIRQGEEQDFTPQLYIEPTEDIDPTTYETALQEGIKKLQNSYPELDLTKEEGNRWLVVIPEKYRVGHEAHFSQVTQKFLQYLIEGELPEWEVPNMIAKYYTTTKVLEVAKQNEIKN